MTFGFKSLMTRSMTADAVMTGMAVPGPRRPMRWPTLAAIICGSIVFIVAVVGALFFTFRPVTLRIAVGPLNTDDARTIAALAQGFARERSYTKLRVVNVGSGADG